MRLRFYIDPETEGPHIYNHGVSESEVEQVLGKAGEIGQARTAPGSQSGVLYLGGC
jgi:hypothetical protein